MAAKFVSIILVFGFGCLSNAAPKDMSKELASRLERKIKASGFKKSQLGIYVGLSRDGEHKQAYALNESKMMIPASLSKVVTAGVILSKLGPSKTFKTQLLAGPKITKGVLDGPLYLKGFGDSGFVSEDMWVLVNDLVRTGVQVIKGDIIVDDTWFDSVRKDPTRDGSNVDRAYAAPIGAMSFNWNSVNVYIRPGEKVGDKARVISDPDNDFIRVINKTKTVRKGSRNSFKVTRSEGGKGFHGNVIRVTGNVSQSLGEDVEYKSITKPDYWSGYNLKAFLQQRGIEVEGKIVTGKAPADAQVIAEKESKPVALLVRDMMKFSNNYVAEMLTKHLAAESGEIPASMETGISILQSQLADWKLSDGMKIFNPSGLTRKNKMKAKSLYLLLKKLTEKFDVFAENLASYPIAGIDGTLKRRMKSGPATGWVRAKTGLLSGVSGLAGYAGRKDGSLATFVFLFNGSGSKTYDSRKLFDDLATELAR